MSKRAKRTSKTAKTSAGKLKRASASVINADTVMRMTMTAGQVKFTSQESG